jgi:MFS family permease
MPLLGLVLANQGVDKSLIGLSTATQSAAIFFVAPFVASLIRRFGLARLMIGSTFFSVAVFMLLPVFANVYAWFPLRFLLGAGGAIVWISGEAWINQIVEDQRRGRVIALYSAALSGGTAIGPMVLAQTGTGGWLPFLVSGGLIAVSSLPLFLAAKASPAMEERPSVRFHMFLLLAPTALLLNGVFAATEMALITFLPIYTLALGLGESTSLYLLAVMAVGGLVFQLPMGWLADHVNRRLLVIASILFLIAGIAAMPFVLSLASWNMVFIFFFGGVFSSLYALALILLGERFRGADLASATAVFTVMWGVGSIAGPPIGGAAMDFWQPHGLQLAIGLMLLAFLPVPIIGYLKRRRRAA